MHVLFNQQNGLTLMIGMPPGSMDNDAIKQKPGGNDNEKLNN